MGLFSIFKKNKSNKNALGSEAINSIFDAANESVNAYNMMEKEMLPCCVEECSIEPRNRLYYF